VEVNEKVLQEMLNQALIGSKTGELPQQAK
jgi:hypothetical protein